MVELFLMSVVFYGHVRLRRRVSKQESDIGKNALFFRGNMFDLKDALEKFSDGTLVRKITEKREEMECIR